MNQESDWIAKRKHVRINKKCRLSYYFRDSLENKSDKTATLDISKGGVKFTTSNPITPGTFLIFNIAIPDTTSKILIVEGKVLESKEIKLRISYEIRAQFTLMDEEIAQLFDLFEKQNSKDT